MALRVLIVTGIFPPDIGGPATYVPQIASGLGERGHEITAVTLSDRVDHDNSPYPFRVVCIRRGLFKPLRILLTVWKVLRLGKKADVLFVNGLFLESVIANYFLRKPMVQKIVGDWAWERATNKSWVKDSFEEFQTKSYGLKVEVLRRLKNWLAYRADRVVVPSRYLARWVAQWGIPQHKINVIYNGIEPTNGIQPARLPLATNLKLKVVTAGRLVQWKRVDGLIKIVARMRDVGLVVIGDGPQRGRLEKLAAGLKVSDRVYFAGARRRQDILGLIAACDLFVLNSTYEGLPHVAQEAMALGCPVVATAVGGTPEVVKNGETGLLVGLEDGALQMALHRLILDGEGRRRMAERARVFLTRATDFATMVRRTEDTLSAVER